MAQVITNSGGPPGRTEPRGGQDVISNSLASILCLAKWKVNEGLVETQEICSVDKSWLPSAKAKSIDASKAISSLHRFSDTGALLL